MGFIVGILIIGALLSTIFGRRVGAMFVAGTGALVLLGIGVLLLLLSPMIIDFFREPSHVSSESTSYTSLSDSTRYSARASGNGYSPEPPATDTVYQAHAASSTGASSSPVAPRPDGPTMGVTMQPADPRLSAQFSMSPGYGAEVVSVAPGGPAAQVGLVPRDFIQAMDADPITADHTLADYEAAKGAGQPITLSVEHNDGSRWMYESVRAIPR